MAEPQENPLSAAQRSRIRRLSQPKDAELGEEAGELNIVPYLDIIMNILMFVLVSVSVTFIATIDTTPPAIGGAKRPDVTSKALNLSAFVTAGGVSLKITNGNVAPGCEGVGPGVTVPKNGDNYDMKNLTVCAKHLKNSQVEFKDETQVTITASSGIEFGTIIAVMDALRRDGDEELFPDVHFGVAR